MKIIMKKKRVSKRLSLGKEIVANLNSNNMLDVKGGSNITCGGACIPIDSINNCLSLKLK